MIRTIQGISIWKTGWNERQHKLFIHQIWSARPWIRTFVRCIRLIIVDCKCRFTSLVLGRQCSIDKFSFLVRWNETCSLCFLLVCWLVTLFNEKIIIKCVLIRHRSQEWEFFFHFFFIRNLNVHCEQMICN